MIMSDPDELLARQLFCRLYGLSEPILKFEEIPHWEAMIRRWGLTQLPMQKEKVFVACGYFYQIHSQWPSLDMIIESEKKATALGADWILWPLLRNNKENEIRLEKYTKLTWFLESVLELKENSDLDAFLWQQLGKSTFKNIQRLNRKAIAEYKTSYLSLPKSSLRETAKFDTLHNLNLKQYKIPVNMFNNDILTCLANSDLAAEFFLCLREENNGAKTVQASLNRQNDKERTFYFLVQGQDRSQVPPYHNLYLAETYELMKKGFNDGILNYNLGRGAPFTKSKLGCNEFYILSNYIKKLKPCSNYFEQVSTLEHHAKTNKQVELASLESAIEKTKIRIS